MGASGSVGRETPTFQGAGLPADGVLGGLPSGVIRSVIISKAMDHVG